MTTPIVKIPSLENTKAGGIDIQGHTNEPSWLSHNPEPKTFPYPVSDALKLTGCKYRQVLALNDDHELINATFDATGSATTNPVGFAGASLKAGTTTGHLTVYIAAHVNIDILEWDASWTKEAKETAFNQTDTHANTNILLGYAAKRMAT